MTGKSNEVRAAARERLEERRGFVPHLILYVVINAGLVVVWAMAGSDELFWPVFALLFWGAGLLMHAWNAFFATPITEADVDTEAERLDRPADEPRTD